MLTLAHAGSPAVADAGEALAAVVVEQLRPSPAIEQEILVAVVVVVAPDRPHRDAGLGVVQIGNAQLLGDLFERAVAAIAIQPILRSSRLLVT